MSACFPRYRGIAARLLDLWPAPLYVGAVRKLLSALVAGSLAACASATGTSEPEPTTDVSPTEPAPTAPATAAPAAPPAQAGMPSAVVREVARELALLKETHYQHTTHVVETEGAFDVDCSGWLDYVFAHAAPSRFTALTSATKTRPLASDWVAFFSSEPIAATGWRTLVTVTELVPGDVVAWLLPPSSNDTGHTMIVRAAPRARDATSYIVPVWDSVASPHGPTDSRAATNATGIGEGEIVLLVDASGAPIGHQWSDGSKTLTQQITLGGAR